MFGEVGAVPNSLLRLAERAAAPQMSAMALNRRFGPRSAWAPASGQIWRAVHEGCTALLLLVGVDADAVIAMPVTVDRIEIVDTLVLENAAFGVPVTVWAGLRRSLPMCVLDRPVDEVAPDMVREAERVAAVVDHASPGGFAASVLEIRAELEDDLAAFEEARAEPAPPTSVAGGMEVGPGIDFDALAPAALDEAAMRLNAPLAEVLDLLDGKRPLTSTEAEVFRVVLGTTPVVAPPPAGLLTELTHPRWRGLVREYGRRSDLIETDARSVMAYEVYGMAARQTGGQSPSWSQRIRLWAQAHQLDPDVEA